MPSTLFVAVFCALAQRAPAQSTTTTLAGENATGVWLGSTDGEGTAVLFNTPTAVAVVASGAVLVADTSNHKVRVVHPNQTVATLAGGGANGTTSGATNGAGTAALFFAPYGVAADASGAVFISDRNNHLIRLLHPNLTVITVAGGATSGATNGVGTAALFFSPSGLALDTSGALFVADFNNHRIRLLFPNRTVITLAGSSLGSTNGVGTAALFNQPAGVAVDASGVAYVADTFSHKIRAILPNRTVITLAGGATSGASNGVGTAALFNQPRGIAVGASGAVYVSDRNNHKLRLMHPNRTVITLAGGGTGGSALGSSNGVGAAALFNQPVGIAVDASGAVFVADSLNHRVRVVYPFSCPPGTFASFSSRSCLVCPGGTCSRPPYGSTSCDACPAGHACPPGTASWARLNCGRGNFCPQGSAEPIPCPLEAAPAPHASWASHPLTAQGPAFLLETSPCLNHCFWNFTSGDGMLSKC